MAFAMLSVDDGDWGDRWQDADKLNRQNFKIPNPPSIANVLQTLRAAVKGAGTTGTLILNVGHGHLLFVCQPGKVCQPPTSFEGSVDLAPKDLITVGGQNIGPPMVFVSVFYDVPRLSSAEKTPGSRLPSGRARS